MWNPDRYIKQLIDGMEKSREALSKDKCWNDRRQSLLRELSKTLGRFSDNSGRPLQARQLEHVEISTMVWERIEYTVDEGLTVPAYVVSPKEPTVRKRPAIVALHGHGWGSREMVGLLPSGKPNVNDDHIPSGHGTIIHQLAERGFVVVVPEIVGFGDRRLTQDNGGDDPKANSCFPLAAALLLAGKTLAGLRVYEASRAVDYVLQRGDTDSQRIGVIGFSGGGMIASLVAATDDRIGAAAIYGYASTYRGSILARRHCLDNYLPGILQHAEMPDLLGLIAPRPLFIESGLEDPLFPAEQVREAIREIKAIYREMECEERFAFDLFEGGHEMNGRHSLDWLESNV
ncbi:dienelactone hydrolase family protein [Cohnella sp.]|uniref:dienelactone hydrolase family protein n=1 Tax=Cohnella sp. TaxID=1883426 RepID=UPI003561C3E6